MFCINKFNNNNKKTEVEINVRPTADSCKRFISQNTQIHASILIIEQELPIEFINIANEVSGVSVELYRNVAIVHTRKERRKNEIIERIVKNESRNRFRWKKKLWISIAKCKIEITWHKDLWRKKIPRNKEREKLFNSIKCKMRSINLFAKSKTIWSQTSKIVPYLDEYLWYNSLSFVNCNETKIKIQKKKREINIFNMNDRNKTNYARNNDSNNVAKWIVTQLLSWSIS